MTDPHAPGDADAARLVARYATLPLPALVDALRAEQSGAWRGGRRVPAEAYLAAFPALAGSTEDALVLIAGEMALRLQLGEAPALAEYQARFPRHAEALALQFALLDG